MLELVEMLKRVTFVLLDKPITGLYIYRAILAVHSLVKKGFINVRFKYV